MKRNSLKNKILKYLLIFTFVILGGIWFLQILSLDIYYELSKKSEIKNIASKVKMAYAANDYSNILDNLAYREDVCIEIIEDKNISYFTDSVSRGCLIGSNELNSYKLSFMSSGNNSVTYRVINPRFKNKALIYGLKIDENTYAFISTSLEPISSTVSLLKRQLILTIGIVLLVAFLIAYTISKKISRPIEKITNISKKMSSGNYDVKFDTGTDINEIKELEITLNKMSEELSKTENLRREFLANVSHDLKTPLTLIKANAEMVRDLNYNNKEKREKSLNTVTSEVDRLNLLVEDILDLSKMQSNADDLDLEEFNISEVIRTIVERFNVLCERDGYSIECDLFDFNITADKKKIEQVIYNLITNAMNYTGDDRKVFIKMKNDDRKVRIEIIDTGAGINEEDLEHIWDKYYKADKKYKRVTYGTGLGLSIVKNILNLHNFEYGVESEKSKGTTFYFYVKK